jgi:hypothetical protein
MLARGGGGSATPTPRRRSRPRSGTRSSDTWVFTGLTDTTSSARAAAAPRTSAHPSPVFTQPLSVPKLRPVSDGRADGHESEGGGVCPGPSCHIAAGGVTGGLHGMVGGDVGDAISDLFSG